jgi:hypothetical protein
MESMLMRCSIMCSGAVAALSFGDKHRGAGSSPCGCEAGKCADSKIKGPTRRVVEIVSAHGVEWHALKMARAGPARNQIQSSAT